MKKNKQRSSAGKNVFQLLYSTMISSGVFALILILIANYLNTEEYAMISVAIAISMIMTFFTDMGISNGFLREGSKKEVSLNFLVGSYIKWRIICLLTSLIFTILLIELFYGGKSDLKSILYCLTLPMITGLAMQSMGITYYQLQERMQKAGLIRIINSVILIFLMALGILLQIDILIISFLFGFSYLLGGIYSLVLVMRDLSITWKHASYPPMLSEIGQFFISGILILLIPHIGPILLEKTISLKEVGLFAVIYRIPSALYQLPGAVAGAFFPVLFRYYHSNLHTHHLQLHILQIKWMGYIGMLITIPIIHLSFFFINILLGSEWSRAATLLPYIAPILFLQSISIALADGLTTKGLQKRRTIVQLGAFLLALFGYYFASTLLGLPGAIGIAILIEGILIFGFWIMNPSRKTLMKQALFSHFLIFTGSLSIILLFIKNSPIIAVFCHLLLVLFFMFLDKSLRNQIIPYLKIFFKKVDRRKKVKTYH
ncbi:oligosaccharide flippase family protein [Metabacillus fastidiosus]|uniref:lipopolysaccharide biosynthesis protein n=1 Tax=Metabacillus fastidiosus TaxID=1458 RepID=UPI003D26944B